MTTWKIDVPPQENSPLVRLVLVRHGQTSWNAAGLIQGHQGPGLDETGSTQAQEVAQQLMGQFPNPNLIFASDLPRCLETAAPYVSRLGQSLIKEPRLREIDNGDWSGYSTAQIAVEYAETIERIRHDEDIARGGGETSAQLRSRTRAFTDELRNYAAECDAAEDFTVVAFSHGGTIRALFAEALNVPHGLQLFGPVRNCAISVLELHGHHTAVVTQYNHYPSPQTVYQPQEN